MSKDRIEIGDRVEVVLPGSPTLKGTVLGIPCATGDCWRIRGNAGALVYVQCFETMALLEDSE